MNNLFVILSLSLLLLSSSLVEGKFKFSHRDSTRDTTTSKHKIYSKEYYSTEYLKTSNIKSSPNDFLVKNLPGLDPKVNLTSYAGLINVNETSNGNLFFWFFPANESVINRLDAPLLVWINGGPGCSSMDSVFIETGPLRFDGESDDTDKFYINPWSWHNSANMLYIDQPVGTGLSYVVDDAGINVNDLQINQNFYQFLQSWLAIFSDYSKLPFYISGESYAGHYIPMMSSYILNMNKNPLNNTIPINIQGVAIGNGYTHPTVQINSYREFGYYSVGILSKQQYNAYEELNNQCQIQLDAGNYNSDECADVFNQLLNDSGSNTTTQVNMYDFRLNDPTAGNNWPLPGINQEAVYLNRADVRAAIHATAVPHPWNECNDTVNSVLTNQDESTLYIFPELLSNIQVLVYNGQFDIICNHVGTTEYLAGLEWSGSEEWANAKRFTWTSTDEYGELASGGYGKQAQNLTFLLCIGGSHMYPMNMPSTSFDMITRFLNKKSFADLPQTIGVPTITPQTNNVPMTLGFWIGITIGGTVFGILAGGIISFLIMRKSNSNYYKVIQ